MKVKLFSRNIFQDRKFLIFPHRTQWYLEDMFDNNQLLLTNYWFLTSLQKTFPLLLVRYVHSVNIWTFSRHLDFTWNQFWWISTVNKSQNSFQNHKNWIHVVSGRRKNSTIFTLWSGNFCQFACRFSKRPIISIWSPLFGSFAY